MLGEAGSLLLNALLRRQRSEYWTTIYVSTTAGTNQARWFGQADFTRNPQLRISPLHRSIVKLPMLQRLLNLLDGSMSLCGGYPHNRSTKSGSRRIS